MLTFHPKNARVPDGLRENSVHPDIEPSWLAHANQTTGDDHSMLKKNLNLRKQIGDKIAQDLNRRIQSMLQVVPNVSKTLEEVLV
jgi:hypothetical protein